MNGYVSLRRPVVDPRPQLFPVPRRALIAPFWADIDLSVGRSASVYYRQYTDDDDDDAGGVLAAAADLIGRHTPDIDFVPTSVAKITWTDVPPYPSATTADTEVRQ